MSFCSDIKSEIINKPLEENHLLPLLCGFALQYKNDTKQIIRIKSIQLSIIKFINDIIFKLYNKKYPISNDLKHKITKETVYSIDINQEDFNSTINQDLEKCKKFINSSMIRPFITGIFLSNGYINDPNSKKYMLYMKFKDEEIPNQIISKLSSYEDERKISFKIIKVKNHIEIYLKKSDQIANFLAFINAHVSMLNFENIRLTKDFYNNTNRLAICDSVNFAKTLKTSQKNLSDIELLETKFSYLILDERLKKLIELRKENPEASYGELADLSTLQGSPISKSTVAKLFVQLSNIVHKS